MQVTPTELEALATQTEAWNNGMAEHPSTIISDELFDRILADLQRLRAIEVGQGELL